MATTLTAGDVAIIRSDHSGTDDDFTFVLLADVDASTQIGFTNIGVSGGQYGNGAGAVMTWTSGTALAAGTVITIAETSSNTFTTTGGGSTAFIGAQNASGFTLGSLGDQLIAFQGTYAANGSGMTELFGLHADGDGSFTQAGWDATVNFIDNDSQLPPDLTPGTTAVALDGSGNNTNAVYTGPTTGSRATLLAAIADPTNWTTSTSTQTAPTGPFTITTASPPVVTPGGGSQTFSEATGTPVAVDAALTVSDSDSPTLVSATVAITANFQAGADVLAFTGSGATGNITGSYAAGTGVLTLSSAGGTATVAQWQAALRAVTYANSSDDPSTGARTISFAVSDGSEVSTTQTSTVNVTAVNDAPTLTATGTTATFTEGGSATDLFSGVAASTVEAGQTFSGLTLTVTNVTDGGSEILSVDGTSIGLANGNSGTTASNSLTFSVSVAGGTATLTLGGGTLSAAQLQTLIDALAYRNSSDDPTVGARTVTLTSVTDSGGTANGGVDTTSVSIGATVTVAAVNDAPTLTATGATATFTEGGSAADLFSSVSASTVEAGQSFTGLTLTVSNVTDGAAELLTVDGTSIELTNGNSGTTAFSGLTFSISVVGGTATLTLSGGTLSADALQTLIDALAYRNSSDDPTAGARTVTLTSLTDNGGTASGGVDTATLSIGATVTVAAVNDAPTLTATGATATFTEGGASTDLFSGISASTVEAGQTFSALSLTVSNVSDGAAEVLTVDGLTIALTNANTGTTVTNGLTFAVSVVAGTATLTLSGGTLSAAQLQTLVDALTYRNSSQDPTAGARTVTLTSVTDSGGTASGGVDATALAIGATVTVAAVNDAPTLTATGATTNFTEGGSAADLFSGVSASTVESGQSFSDLSLTVSNVTDGAAEILTVDGTSIALTNANTGTTVTNGLSFAVSVVAGTATLTLSGGTLSAAALQTLIDALAYRNSSDDPTAGARTVTLTSVTDSGGTASGGVDTTALSIGATVTVAGVNDDPTARDDALGTLENAVVTGSVFADNGNGADIDVDGGTLVVTAVNGVAVSVGQQITLASGALLTLNADGTFGYDPNGAFNALAAAGSGASSGTSATDSFGYEISDGQGGTSSALATVTITGVDSAGDLVTGSAGNDVLDGGIGADTMVGGTGDDIYVVDDAADVVTENAGEGQDVVYANVSYILAANIESLVLYGNGSINGTGNGDANYIFGNAFANVIDGGGGADVMIGSAGNDTYIVDHVDDVVSELVGEGDDTVQTSVNYGMHDHVEFLIMTGTDDLEARGNALANTITGNAGNNAIDGGAGTDIMAGGAGDDRYAVDNIYDRIIETAGGGNDTVYASTDHQLDANVETLILTGTAMRGFGSDDDNQIFGNDQVNVLYGRGGTDYMVGGGGDDIFVITPETGSVDVIGDFTGAGVAGGDRLSFGGFGAGATVKQLSQTSFEVASADGLTVQQFILASHDGTALTADDYYFS